VTRPSLDAEDDQTLVLRTGEGDVAAYRELVRRHSRKLHHYAFRMTRIEAEAEDIVQETFMRLYQRAADYEPEARVTTWLHRIAHNLAVDRLRTRGRWTSMDEEESDEEREDVESARPAELLDGKRRAERLTAALEELPERQRAALVLVYLNDLSGAEAAGVLGVSAEAVESLLARGRRALRHRLGDHAPRSDGGTS
jgi:RNA polymerase sigma-70 factor (ECF subfamily)